jgi:hypothetical protein
MTGAGEQAVLPHDAEPSVLRVEQRGIEYVPRDSRWGKPSGLFWMWAARGLIVGGLVYWLLARREVRAEGESAPVPA